MLISQILERLSAFLFLSSIAITYMPLHEVKAENKEVVQFETDFVPDPQTSSFKESFIHMSTNREASIKSFTYCFRMKLLSTIEQCLFYENGLGFKSQNENFGFIVLHNAWITFEYDKPLAPLKWYHVCMSYDSGHILLVMNNATLINKESSDLKSLAQSELVLNDGLTLGICKDLNKGSPNPLEIITRGSLTDFNMWSTSFKEKDLLHFTEDCTVFSTEPDVISWKDLENARKGGNVKILQLGISEVCKKKNSYRTHKTLLAIPIKMTYDLSKNLCSSLGGNFPIFRDEKDIISWNRTITVKSRYDTDSRVDLVRNACEYKFWAPIRQKVVKNAAGDKEYIWSEDISSKEQFAKYLPWEFSQPNGLKYQQCVQISLETREIGDFDCNTKRLCSICEFHDSVKFYFRGLPEISSVDKDFIFVPEMQTGDGLTILGYKQYLIRWMYENGVWEIIDRSDLGQAIATFDNSPSKFPVGNRIWQIAAQNHFGKNIKNNVINLKLSRVRICKKFLNFL